MTVSLNAIWQGYLKAVGWVEDHPHLTLWLWLAVAVIAVALVF